MLDPRAAAHRPSRAVLHVERKAEPRAFVCRELDEIVPLLAQTPDLLARARPPAAELAVEKLNAADSRRLDRLEICREPFARDVAADEVKPRLRSMIAPRLEKCSPRERRRRKNGGSGENLFHV